MRTIFDDDHQAFRESFAAFVAKEATPHYLEWEAAGIAPRELFLAAGQYGFLGMAIPEQYGGGGTNDFRFNADHQRGVRCSGHRRSGARPDAAQRHHDAVLHRVLHRRASAALAAGDRLR